MKKVFTLVLLLLKVFTTNAQKDQRLIIDSIAVLQPELSWIRIDTGLIINLPICDTMPVIILCSDTSKMQFTGANAVRQANGSTFTVMTSDQWHSPFVTWMRGYHIRCGDDYWSGSIGHDIFLDDKKRPLQRKFVVWQYRPAHPFTNLKRAF